MSLIAFLVTMVCNPSLHQTRSSNEPVISHGICIVTKPYQTQSWSCCCSAISFPTKPEAPQPNERKPDAMLIETLRFRAGPEARFQGRWLFSSPLPNRLLNRERLHIGVAGGFRGKVRKAQQDSCAISLPWICQLPAAGLQL